jgi:hypothetical protein
MSDTLLVLTIVAFFVAATLLLRVCRRVIAGSVEEAERDALESEREQGPRA